MRRLKMLLVEGFQRQEVRMRRSLIDFHYPGQGMPSAALMIKNCIVQVEKNCGAHIPILLCQKSRYPVPESTSFRWHVSLLKIRVKLPSCPSRSVTDAGSY